MAMVNSLQQNSEMCWKLWPKARGVRNAGGRCKGIERQLPQLSSTLPHCPQQREALVELRTCNEFETAWLALHHLGINRNHPSTDRRNAKVGNWNIPKTLHSGLAEHWQKLTMNGAGDLSQQECQQLMQGLDRDQNGNLAILPIDLKQGEGLVLVLWLLPKVSHSYDNRRVLGSSGEKWPCQRHHNCAVCYISAAVSPYRLALRDRWSLYFSIVFCSNNDLSMPRSNCLEA